MSPCLRLFFLFFFLGTTEILHAEVEVFTNQYAGFSFTYPSDKLEIEDAAPILQPSGILLRSKIQGANGSLYPSVSIEIFKDKGSLTDPHTVEALLKTRFDRLKLVGVNDAKIESITSLRSKFTKDFLPVVISKYSLKNKAGIEIKVFESLYLFPRNENLIFGISYIDEEEAFKNDEKIRDVIYGTFHTIETIPVPKELPVRTPHSISSDISLWIQGVLIVVVCFIIVRIIRKKKR